MSIARTLLMPWWAARLGTGDKAFCDNPLIGSRALNERGLHAARVALAARMAARRRAALAYLVSPADRAAFDRDGFVAKRDFLPPAAFRALRDQALGHAGPAREMVQGDTITRRMAIDPAALRAMPAMRDLLANPVWRGLTRYVASADQQPLVYIQSILSHRHAAPPDPQEALHADTFHATMKAWLFLTDVGADEGPFTYVPGSHRATPERLAWERARSLEGGGPDRLSQRGSPRIARDELAGLGLPDPVALAVPANTLVVADTFGFHARGPSVRPATRVEVWAYHRRNPFLPWAGFDPLGLPGIAERRVPLWWAFSDRFERYVGQPWADKGVKRPADE